jgi:nucleoside-diphosphate-sugar epimerase
VDTIIYLMDIKPLTKGRKKKDEKININGTLNHMIAAKRVNVPRFIFLSTYGVYGKTDSSPLKEEDRKSHTPPMGKISSRQNNCAQPMQKKTIAISQL